MCIIIQIKVCIFYHESIFNLIFRFNITYIIPLHVMEV